MLSQLPASLQQPFVFLLEASDSHLMLTVVARHMAGMLQVFLRCTCVPSRGRSRSNRPHVALLFALGTCTAGGTPVYS